MRKVFLLAVTIMGLSFSLKAQDLSKNAIGLRLGSNDGFGAGISYQRALTETNRLEFDLGWRNSNNVNAIKLAGLYQWVWNIEGGFNWYAGAGAGIGTWSYETHGLSDSGTILFGAGNIGVEYNINEVPVQLSLDYRPELYFNSGRYRDGNFGSDIALGIRYKF